MVDINTSPAEGVEGWVLLRCVPGGLGAEPSLHLGQDLEASRPRLWAVGDMFTFAKVRLTNLHLIQQMSGLSTKATGTDP